MDADIYPPFSYGNSWGLNRYVKLDEGYDRERPANIHLVGNKWDPKGIYRSENPYWNSWRLLTRSELYCDVPRWLKSGHTADDLVSALSKSFPAYLPGRDQFLPGDDLTSMMARTDIIIRKLSFMNRHFLKLFRRITSSVLESRPPDIYFGYWDSWFQLSGNGFFYCVDRKIDTSILDDSEMFIYKRYKNFVIYEISWMLSSIFPTATEISTSKRIAVSFLREWKIIALAHEYETRRRHRGQI